MELILGTAQFGTAYGVVGRTAPPGDREIQRILDAAWQGGVRLLDTATAYGDIEQRLHGLCGTHGFQVISKFPAVPSDLPPAERRNWALAAAETCRIRLGDRLLGLMAHNANDILDDEPLSEALANWAVRQGVRIGASCYSAADARRILESRGMELFQVPANALDQRVSDAFPVSRQKLELQVRSAFLQGLLLAGESVAAARLPAAADALGRWYGWCREMGFKPLDAALSIVKGFLPVSGVVVGVDDSLQLDEIINAWTIAKPLSEKGLATQDERIIDPRQWTIPTPA